MNVKSFTISLYIILLKIASIEAQIVYSYDSLNRMDSVIQSNGEFTKYIYDDLGNRISKSFGILLPDSNFTYDVKPIECNGEKPGEIHIKSKVYFSWTVEVLGPNGYRLDTSFSYQNYISDNGLVIPNLVEDEYVIIFTYGSYPFSVFNHYDDIKIPVIKPKNAPILSYDNLHSGEISLINGVTPIELYINDVLRDSFTSSNQQFTVNQCDSISVQDYCLDSAFIYYYPGPEVSWNYATLDEKCDGYNDGSIRFFTLDSFRHTLNFTGVDYMLDTIVSSVVSDTHRIGNLAPGIYDLVTGIEHCTLNEYTTFGPFEIGSAPLPPKLGYELNTNDYLIVLEDGHLPADFFINGQKVRTINSPNFTLYASPNDTVSIVDFCRFGDTIVIPDSTTSSVKNSVNGKKVIVYPNPTNETLTIAIENGTESRIQVNVYDMIGKQVMTRNLNQSGSEFKLDVATLPSGSYTLTIEEYNVNLRFVKN